MFPHPRRTVRIVRLSLMALLLACLTIRPVLLVVEPLHEFERVVALDAQLDHDRAGVERIASECGQAPLHAPGMHRLIQRHGVIVVAEVPVPAPIRAMAAGGAVRFACADVPVAVARYAVPLRPPIA